MGSTVLTADDCDVQVSRASGLAKSDGESDRRVRGVGR